MSTYFGSITIVLKFPFTRAESAKGLHKYRGLEMAPSSLDAEPREFVRERVPELGVGERLGLLGALFLFLSFSTSVAVAVGGRRKNDTRRTTYFLLKGYRRLLGARSNDKARNDA